ncbi:manganese efflux pump MntP [bioreactor metagenome]|uniref:Manganese efflux pump MntP n=1 Tax=bioreactor metagenome TaxID=1076179 RepID=A0A644SVS5_9ZZZZ|nr:sporulation membrane protein YtaF [Negativicutes bacterium]
MDLVYVLILAFAVSMDGFVAGMAYGLRNIRLPFTSIVIVGIVTMVGTAFSMACAYLLGQVINTQLAIIMGAMLLIFLGFWSLFQQYFTSKVPSYELEGEMTVRKLTFSMGQLVVSIMAKPETADVDRKGNINSLEAVFLGLAVALDAMVATFGAALMGMLPIYTPLAVGIIHMICVAGGCYSSAKFVSDKLKKRFPYLPGVILILLGLLRLG